ncbi:hypothetical protein [Leptospira idonii]|uniref:Lipoprotein n=1 Tax=Leptospira idonii TaxID=1193500 RepID=A0A4R9LXS3_9LEPT|nr:hypothetical protein [Leptospira idonii]TGN18225.1 hypothetical protein EHS15_12500 [Leptospira idonii]
MKKTFYLFLLTGFLFVPACSKKTVTKYERPQNIYFIQSNAEISLFKETGSGSEKLGTIQETDSVEVISQIVTKNKDQDWVDYEIKCPERFSEKCKEGLGYLRDDEIISAVYVSKIQNGHANIRDVPGKKGTILPKTTVESATSTRNWISEPNKQLSVVVDKESFFFVVSSLFPNTDDQFRIWGELEIFSELLNDPSYKDSRYEAVFKKYSILKELEKKKKKPSKEDTTTPSLSGFDPIIIEGIRSRKEEAEKNYFSGFPMRSPTYKGLVFQFNKAKQYPFVQEKLFLEISKNAAYQITGGPAGLNLFTNTESATDAVEKLKSAGQSLESGTIIGNGKIEILGKEGSRFLLTQLDFQGKERSVQNYEIKSIVAEESGGSVGFRFKLDQTEIVLTPLVVSDYLLASGQGFKEFLATIPNDYKEILKNNSYNKALVLIAVKFGAGGFDELTGKMKYSIPSSTRYWTVLELVRLHPNITRTGDYSGSFADNSYESKQGRYTDLKWRQPKGQFYISGQYSPEDDSDVKYDRTEDLCFTESGSDDLEISFSPSEMRSEHPNVRVLFTKEFGNLCDYLNSYLFGASEEG